MRTNYEMIVNFSFEFNFQPNKSQWAVPPARGLKNTFNPSQ